MKTSMKDRVLERLIAEIEKPITGLRQANHHMQGEISRLQAERDRLAAESKDFTKAQLAFTDLHRAATRVSKGARGEAIVEMKAALKAAEPHIDWIPF